MEKAARRRLGGFLPASSTLCDHVGDVIQFRSNEKMFGVETRRVVAMVAYVEAVWEIRIQKELCTDPMNQSIASLDVFDSVAASPCPRPFPTARFRVYLSFSKKVVLKCFGP